MNLLAAISAFSFCVAAIAANRLMIDEPKRPSRWHFARSFAVAMLVIIAAAAVWSYCTYQQIDFR